MKVNNKVIEIQNYLPHRSPMLMVDIITEINQKSVTTNFEVKRDNLFIVDGVLTESGLIENAAQTCSAIVGQNFFFDENQEERQDVDVIGFISSIKKITVFKLPKVDQTIQTEGTLISKMDGEGFSICVIAVSSYADQEKLLEAEMNLFLQKQ